MTKDEAIKWLKVESSYIEENVGHGKEILLTEKYTNRRTGSTEYYVTKDTCFYDDDGYYLDSNHDWCDDVVAWMPLPEPYKGESEVKEKIGGM